MFRVFGTLLKGATAAKPNASSSSSSASKVSAKALAALAGRSIDASVQHTNDDSVLSKRSAAKHGYLEDNYLRHFVKKPARRAPLINRGYYLRIVAMTALVEQCLQGFNRRLKEEEGEELDLSSGGATGRVQVLSLGAGFDTLAPRLYSNPLYANVHFYEVDFPPVIANKTGLVAAAPRGSFPFLSKEGGDGEAGAAEVEGIRKGATTMNFGRYHSLGLDLRETEEKLASLLAAQGFDFDAPTVVYAECVMQYMTPDCSDGVVRWVAQHLPNAIFMAYDQINHLDSFGGVMQRSLRSKCSPLVGIYSLPDGIALSRRAARMGLEEVRFANFYDLSQYHIAKAEKARVDALEMFDEFEEWHEMCEHYGILCARTRKDSRLAELPNHPALVDVLEQHERDEQHLATLSAEGTRVDEPLGSATNPTHPTSLLTVSPWPNARLGLECYSNGSVHSEKVEGSDDHTCIISFGGVSISKGTTRTDALTVQSLRDGDLRVVNILSEAADDAMLPPPTLQGKSGNGLHRSSRPSARSHHTFTRIAPYTFVVFGGRTNPQCVYNEAYLCEVMVRDGAGAATAAARWTRLVPADASAPLPPPRFRHTDVALGDGRSFVVIGGRDGTGGGRLGDVWRAVVDVHAGTISWSQMALEGPSVFPAHCTAAACLVPSVGSGSTGPAPLNVVLSGGMAADDAPVGTAYHLALDTDRMRCRVEELSWARRVGPTVMGRYSHTMTALPPSSTSSSSSSSPRLFIFGGLGFVPKVRTQYWQPLIVENPLAGDASSVATIAPMPAGHERTSFVRHSVVRIGSSIDASLTTPSSSGGGGVTLLGVLGGGFTSFSFGIYSPTPILLGVGGGEASQTAAATSAAANESSAPAPSNTPSSAVKLPVMRAVDSVAYSSDRWELLKTSPCPVVLRGAPIGPCADLWPDPRYLQGAMAADTTVSVHVANKKGNALLDFVHKNFDFRHVKFSELVAHCWPAAVKEGDGIGERTDLRPSDYGSDETWYFRSVGANMKTEASNFYRDFGGLSKDFVLPEEVSRFVLDPRAHHQSCFRINQSGMRLWPHYDVMDNILVNVVGRKQVVLFPPTQYTNLYMSGSSSPVLDVCAPDLARFPRALEALRSARVVTLGPRDVLVIPALWIHAVTAVDACISVNLFYKRGTLLRRDGVGVSKSAPPHHGGAAAAAGMGSLSTSSPSGAADLYDTKDLYGNKDLPCMVAAQQAIMAEVGKQMAAAERADVPTEFRALLLQQVISELQFKAEEMHTRSLMRRS